MSKPIRGFLSFLLVLQLIIPYSTFAAAVGEFTSVVGNVRQTRATEVIKPVEKSPIEMKDLIATAQTSSATMVFSDDSKIMLSENTELEIKEFLFKDNARRGIFSLAIGKLTADVRKYIGGYNVFEVISPTVGVGVRGTGFELVEAMRDDKAAAAANQRMATVSCTDGSLNLSAFSDTGAVVSTAVLEAGQMAVIIGGVITISAIAAVAAAGIAKTTEIGTAGTTGGAGTGTGGAAAAGGAAASTGLSTAAIAGIAIGGAAVVGGAAAAVGGGGGSSGGSSGGGGSSSGGGGSSSGPSMLGTSCSQFCSQWPAIYMAGAACTCTDSNTAYAYSPQRLSSKCPANQWGVIAKGWTTGNWSAQYFAPSYSTTACTWSGNDAPFSSCISTIINQMTNYCQ